MKGNSIDLCQTLKNSDSISVLVLDVVVNGDDEHEDKEDASSSKKVPDVVPIVEVGTKLAGLVYLAGLRW